MFIFHEKVKKIDMGEGIVRQDFADGDNLNVLHWNIQDGGEVKMHSHSQEQFGLVIKGGFDMVIAGQKKILKAGDAYIVPANVQHSFIAIGETEAIDVFTPRKEDFPWKE
ncbi:MAG: cupin domain-containing protein [Prolixibacteraceae bacterium]|jgi:quercetin dioxygenase-like cupin family protein|nr:cupin domain-containing protein [Prolixibacteraceae bacterium]MBT6007390.1 cupin domain-containing protein [Prolixibacteraceae bacterium]MBT6765340.1 cupin domain-containing protein [Prolixibacteraceae bacterium]MBT6997534.1 cupin domain-containing protein [Prolixibacteraceae bacterium]MBT7394572.1 cupin domain-containing protein [Prolixibacteraceae bacterium]